MSTGVDDEWGCKFVESLTGQWCGFALRVLCSKTAVQSQRIHTRWEPTELAARASLDNLISAQ